MARRIAEKSIIVPTAERDPALGLGMFGPVFRGVRALMYNSPEEQAMIQPSRATRTCQGWWSASGRTMPARTAADPVPAHFGITGRSRCTSAGSTRTRDATSCSRIFLRYAAAFPHGLDLVLVGNAIIAVPKHPRIRHLGFLDDRDKFDALAAADLLIMPSYFESLSMVALEAWALGRPVLANGRCDVLKGQCIRSKAGLDYERYEEFVEAMYSLESNGPLNARLGQNGRDFFCRHYAWSVIEGSICGCSTG